ncbi:aminoglycoside phosphotransferase family protein [Ktedonosporobacter rubrisoli]|uniref:Aminoglycoside phosphotransferase family protein n=1 Tax=Ktedonosporobacter rubrisoli TaxID=2509675 RepID=A0A4P6JN36_KTERU|nr:aminoglycoside phosphotransferase family protein [Ktedonosporobacter rubrisoli]QBD76126.1 aminoglycoside phosphotransferase family protein [Ktedonosporobacter rubrisoli]
MGTRFEQLTPINKGQSNEVYEIDLKKGSYILRIAKGVGYDIFAVERWAMQEVSRRGVPVANILAQGSEVEGDEAIYYQIQEKLTGEPLDSLLAQGKVGRERATRLTGQAGELLAAIHSVSACGWGRITTPHYATYDSFEEWLLALQEDAEKFDTALATFKTLGAPRFDEVWQELRYLGAFAIRQPVLLHYDLTPDHIFVDNDDSITGIIDWGAVHSGDPVRDFVRWNYWDNYEFSINWLAAAYGQSLATSKGFAERLKLARIIDALLLLESSTYKIPDVADAQHAALVIRDTIK